MPALVEEISPDGLPIDTGKPIDNTHVVIPSDKEVAADDTSNNEETVDFSQFLEKTGKPVKEEAKVEIATDDKSKVPADEKKVDVKDDKIVDLNQQKKQTQKLDATGRDYSDIPEELVPAMKKMSNESFAAVKPILIERNKLFTETTELKKQLEINKKQIADISAGKQTIPENYYDNPHAYLLTPEFQQEAHNSSLAESVMNHWINQLQAVREGAKEISMIGYNERGQLVETGTAPANVKTEIQLQQLVNNAQKQVWDQNAKVESIKKSFVESSSRVSDYVKIEMSKAFGYFDTEEGKKSYEPVIKQVVDGFPPAIRMSPVAQWLARSLVMNGQLAGLLKQAADERAKGGTAATVPAAKKQPSAAEIASEVGDGKGDGEITFDAFKERMKA